MQLGKEKLFVHLKLIKLMTEDNHEFVLYLGGSEFQGQTRLRSDNKHDKT